ncbi:hypothetical protein WA026_003224 [Henosepilachna vigintioctopunctata]|uniref:Alanine--tRNA ligase n=1 Tax=Henosepilachna vigintioctopunctata TaxID=420089 RepID=A0AAW1TMI0_9CUCU
MAFNVGNVSKHINPDRTARIIRQKFMDYFVKDCGHQYVRSSPIVPFCDPTVAFVNAGMNQFKNIFTGNRNPKYRKVANSQKCVRVGGKHNDLNIVGTDGYHHTFFEMLGNWSFGDYFKVEACEMAWKMLVDVYKLPCSRLYVTYFKGDDKLGLEEDIETKEIWRSLGVTMDRIIPFGIRDNFWEMGDIGPCGPCTEIHYDHTGCLNRAQLVNKGLFDLTELWNIVFIQYYRNIDGTISLLPSKHVDTGMGFERLTAVLQNKISNYDTDNFSYLIKAIETNCANIKKYEGKYGEQDWNNLDTSFRTLADHSRMVTACLADGVIPEQNQKLRRILRKCFSLSENVFQKERGLLKELSNYVVDNLGHVYVEMEKNISQIHQIIDYEEEVYRDLKNNARSEWEKLLKDNKQLKSLDILDAPSLIPAYKDLQKIKPSKICGELAFKLYDTFGLDSYTIEKLAIALDIPFDTKGLDSELKKAKHKIKQQVIIKSSVLEELEKECIPKTDDSFKYNFEKVVDDYKFENIAVKVLKIVHHDELVKQIGPNTFCGLLLDKTNFYCESGGQISDKGKIEFDKAIFEVIEVENLNNYVLHKGFLTSKSGYNLCLNSTGMLSIDQENRLDIMRNHSAIHLLNSALKVLKGATCQKSSKVTGNFFNLDVSIFGPKLNNDDIQQLEKRINDIICEKIPVTTKEIDIQTFLELDDVITVPGEIYPEEKIRLIEIKHGKNLISREPCCGTHVSNTGDIGNFSIIKMKSLGRSTVSLHGVTGKKSELAVKNGYEITDEIKRFQKSIAENIDKPDVLDMAVATLRSKITSDIGDSYLIPVNVKQKCLEELNAISKQIKNIAKVTLNDFVDMEMQNVLDSKVQVSKSNKKYIIHYLRISMILENVPLQRATKVCKHIPVMVISYTDNTVQARCCVPKEFCNDNFSADKWMENTVASVFRSPLMVVKGQNEKLICNMKSKRINIQDWDLLLKKSMDTAKDFIENNL